VKVSEKDTDNNQASKHSQSQKERSSESDCSFVVVNVVVGEDDVMDESESVRSINQSPPQEVMKARKKRHTHRNNQHNNQPTKQPTKTIR